MLRPRAPETGRRRASQLLSPPLPTSPSRGIFITGASILGAAVKAPRIRSKNLISVIFCEATAIYGVILAIILTNKSNLPDPANLPVTAASWANYYRLARFAGFAIFWSGLGVGLTNLGSGCVSGGLSAPCLHARQRRAASPAGASRSLPSPPPCHLRASRPPSRPAPPGSASASPALRAPWPTRKTRLSL